MYSYGYPSENGSKFTYHEANLGVPISSCVCYISYQGLTYQSVLLYMGGMYGSDK